MNNEDIQENRLDVEKCEAKSGTDAVDQDDRSILEDSMDCKHGVCAILWKPKRVAAA